MREQDLMQFLKQDIPVLFFPEATTSDGSKIKKVHGRILGAAIEAETTCANLSDLLCESAR